MSAAEVTAIATRPVDAEMSVEQMIAQTQKIQQCMNAVMKKDEHYGVIPGTGTADRPAKPTLLKPGAEKLCLMFRLDPQYEILRAVETPELIAFTIRCQLYHIPTGNRIASGLGSCNSREKKYLREAAKKCPGCGKETIFVTKLENEPKYYCWKKKGGCGAKFKEGDPAIEDQPRGIEDPADLHNTILKMASKRALVAAVLNGTAASDFFTQDLEDLTEKAAEYIPPQGKEGSAPKAESAPRAGTTSATTTAPQAASASTTTNGSAPATSKAPRANTIKHDGTFANHKQVALLHILRTKAGIPECKGDCAKEVTDEKKWGKKTTRIQRCTYHTQLAAFKDCDGKPITTSKDLSEFQISNLIDRYQAKVNAQESRASEPPDLGAMNAGAAELARSKGDLSDEDDPLSEIRRELDAKGDTALMDELCEVFRVPTLDDLPVAEVPAALALVLAWGTNSYKVVLERVRP